MSGKPAARLADPVSHPLPPVLTGVPTSPNILIGYKPAWKGVPAASAAALKTAKKVSDTAIKVAKAATKAASGTPAFPAVKAACLASMGSTISSMSMGADIHICTTPYPIPPHGPGVVINGSKTVLINNLPAARQGDTVLEAIGGPNKISQGCMTVKIGG
ncbi:PAAR motif protein [Candidatus Thiomargarita nelsonii]|uniref:PAAR motif protein n=1 Tax=Candidatus Thiomargarita nelsonii TaxID=1003181 RepID=A0A0A6P559_9GAMM|nr:PAAR motif protein [Candidatus Thiomargarita nelsonii]